MSPTHIAVGLVLSVPVSASFPEYATPVIVSLIIGSTLPDFDIIFAEHRKTLHYPIVGIIGSILFGLLFIFEEGLLFLLLVCFTVGFSIHGLLDVLGGGIEDEPWKRRDNRGVYSHIRGIWIDARYTIGYDGSLTDLLIYFALIAIFWIFAPIGIDTIGYVTLALLSVTAVVYTAFRKTLFNPVYMEENHPRIKNFHSVIFD